MVQLVAIVRMASENFGRQRAPNIDALNVLKL